MASPFPKPVRLVVLDCDGVLFDSRGANVAFYNAVFERMGMPPMDAQLEHYCHFSSSRQLLERAFSDDTERLEQAIGIARGIDYSPFYRHMRPVDGLRATLTSLGRGRELAMATNRTRTGQRVVEVFELGEHIRFVSTVAPDVPPKPAPNMLLRCLAHFEVPADEAVYVGDADSDRVAAEAAGMGFVGVGDEPQSALRVERFAELAEIIPPL